MMEPNSSVSRPIGQRILSFLSLAFAGAIVVGCTDQSLIASSPREPISPLETKYFASDEDVQAGARHLQTGAFALAQESFQKATEKAPSDPVAWLGLAASYDRLRKFDLADRAYEQAYRLQGATVAFHNNRGYSYMLRGNLPNARRQFELAAQIAPDEAAVSNNLRLLDGSRRHVRRLDTAY